MKRVHLTLSLLFTLAITIPTEASRPNASPKQGSPANHQRISGHVGSVMPGRSPGSDQRTMSTRAKPAIRTSLPRPAYSAEDAATKKPNQAGTGTSRGSRLTSQPIPVEREIPESFAAGQRRSIDRTATVERPDFTTQLSGAEIIADPFGNGGGGNGGGGQRPPHGRHPGRGPTAWDVLAIGLATAAFSDQGTTVGGSFLDECVTVEQPACIVENTNMQACTGVAAETQSVALAGDDHDDPAPHQETSTAATRPQLTAGRGFVLPAVGLGAERGRVTVTVGGLVLECAVTRWDDAGLRATVPAMTLVAATKGDLVVTFADGRVAAVLPVEVLPGQRMDAITVH